MNTVKEAGIFECMVYSPGGDVADFLTHEIFISNGIIFALVNCHICTSNERPTIGLSNNR